MTSYWCHTHSTCQCHNTHHQLTDYTHTHTHTRVSVMPSLSSESHLSLLNLTPLMNFYHHPFSLLLVPFVLSLLPLSFPISSFPSNLSIISHLAIDATHPVQSCTLRCPLRLRSWTVETHPSFHHLSLLTTNRYRRRRSKYHPDASRSVDIGRSARARVRLRMHAHAYD